MKKVKPSINSVKKKVIIYKTDHFFQLGNEGREAENWKGRQFWQILKKVEDSHPRLWAGDENVFI